MTTHHSEPAKAVRSAPLLKDGDVVERLKQFRLRWQEDGDLLYLGKALTDAVVEIETLRPATPAPSASGGLEAVRGDESAVECAAIRIIRNRASDGPSADRAVAHAREFDTHVWRDAKRDARAALAAPAATSGDAMQPAIDGFAENAKIAERIFAPAPAVESAQVKAWTDVLAERRRQVEAEGWTPAHDDEHDKGEMAGAAAVYALHGATYKPWQPPEPKGFEAVREARKEASKSLGTLKSALASMRAKNPAPPRCWPWHIDWWKPSDPRRNLVKAGALILAEIERLDRASLATDAEG